eukprot:m.209738 g.209738  ORF g.209738 m.209738 type:complete len:124 (-) comp18547_c0_seq4:27-398(-)
MPWATPPASTVASVGFQATLSCLQPALFVCKNCHEAPFFFPPSLPPLIPRASNNDQTLTQSASSAGTSNQRGKARILAEHELPEDNREFATFRATGRTTVLQQVPTGHPQKAHTHTHAVGVHN